MSATGDGHPPGQLTSPLVPDNVGPDMRLPLDFTLLDMVDEGLAEMSVQSLSPKSKRLRDFVILVAAQKLEQTRLIEVAKGLINLAQGRGRSGPA